MNTWLPLVIGAIMGLGGVILGLFAKAKGKAAEERSKAAALERDAARRNAEVWRQGQVTAADAAERAGEVAEDRARDVAERDAALLELARHDRDAAADLWERSGGVRATEDPVRAGSGEREGVPEGTSAGVPEGRVPRR